jgi:hypothetical protein
MGQKQCTVEIAIATMFSSTLHSISTLMYPRSFPKGRNTAVSDFEYSQKLGTPFETGDSAIQREGECEQVRNYRILP